MNGFSLTVNSRPLVWGNHGSGGAIARAVPGRGPTRRPRSGLEAATV